MNKKWKFGETWRTTIRDAWKMWWPTITIGFIAVVFTIILSTCIFHDIKPNGEPPKSEIIRNYGLLIVAFWGAFLAVWRGQIADRQVKISERGLRNERYQRGAEMLGSEVISTRLGGLYALKRLALDHPEDYLDQIIKLIATFVRHPSQGEKEMAERPQTDASRKLKFRRDVLEAIWVISRLNKSNVAHDKPDLSLANLNHARFTSASPTPKNFINFDFTGAQLEYAEFTGANLAGAIFLEANLTNAKLAGENFTDADLTFAVLDNAMLIGAKELTQAQLNMACQRVRGSPPKLPENLTWDENIAIDLWREYHGDSAQD